MKSATEDVFSLKSQKTFHDRPKDDQSANPARAVDIEGRCWDCWGELSGKKNKYGQWMSIECQSCDQAIAGEQAAQEMKRMCKEANNNLSHARRGLPVICRPDAEFVIKILPDMDRDAAYVEAIVKAKKQHPRKKKISTRHEFPSGAAGNLYLQACALVRGLGSLPRGFPVIPSLGTVLEGMQLQDLRPIGDSEAGGVEIMGTWPAEERGPIGRMGTTLVANMTAAFACELGLKAILMTRNHEFERTHDLKDLYDKLPPDCKQRLEADFPRISNVLLNCRQTFGKWRYFQQDTDAEAIQNLANDERAHNLAKAARVLVDEGVIAGLSFAAKVGPQVKYQIQNGTVERAESSVELTVSESAINWEDLLAFQPSGD